ncbi:hypothetical protein L1987_40250 [Smallanthus sonchifolius]|uniref:Uncharacterized protein n=1 Tax=Smallanthus sonchifolius TaxID=185202 RepID=A0ACB9GSX5_9ASTR|nr:hypothetical protein L1987_40250 [Smallanthus sonchifolius]
MPESGRPGVVKYGDSMPTNPVIPEQQTINIEDTPASSQSVPWDTQVGPSFHGGEEEAVDYGSDGGHECDGAV